MTRSTPGRTTVVVIGGGTGSEHEISVASAAAIAAALNRHRYDVIELTIRRDGAWAQGLSTRPGAAPLADDLADAVRILSRADVAIPALHGPHGEDGTVAALLDLIGIPYVGSGVFAGAVAMDKAATKLLATAAGVAVASGIQVQDADDPRLEAIALPVVVKPNRSGSSHGVTVVRTRGELSAAVREALSLDTSALVEEFIAGREIDLAVIERADGSLECGPALEIGVAEGGVFDTTSKYVGEQDFRIPAPVDESTTLALEDASRTMFRTLDCHGLARVDFFVTNSGSGDRIILNEVNTFPGFTSHSQVPRMFATAGVSYPDLLDMLVETALVRSDGRRIRTRVS